MYKDQEPLNKSVSEKSMRSENVTTEVHTEQDFEDIEVVQPKHKRIESYFKNKSILTSANFDYNKLQPLTEQPRATVSKNPS